MNPLTPAVQNPNPLPLSSAGCSGADEKRTEEYLIVRFSFFIISRSLYFLFGRNRGRVSSSFTHPPPSFSASHPTQILTNLRNASAVWGDSSRQYRACTRAAAEYLGVGVEVEGGLVVGMEGLRL